MKSRKEMINDDFTRPGMKLSYYAAYYKNDEPLGIGIRIEDENTVEKVSQLVINLLYKYEEEWETCSEEQKQIMVSQMFKQLDDWGREKTSLDKIRIMAMANIQFLEMQSLLKTDEHNGCIMGFLPAKS